MFDFKSYLSSLCEQNKLAKTMGVHFCTCTGFGMLEEALDEIRNKKAFVCMSDVTDAATIQRGGGWFKRRLFTAYILEKTEFGDMDGQRAALDRCRELLRQFHSRFIVDEAKLGSEAAYLDVGNLKSRELAGQVLTGYTGLHFMIALDEPLLLAYNDDEWDTTKTKP